MNGWFNNTPFLQFKCGTTVNTLVHPEIVQALQNLSEEVTGLEEKMQEEQDAIWHKRCELRKEREVLCLEREYLRREKETTDKKLDR